MTFDYVVGNPPYQGTRGLRVAYIWEKITLKAYDVLSDNGQMTLVHPATWQLMDPTIVRASKETLRIRDMFFSNKIQHYSAYSVHQGEITFNASTNYCTYCLTKAPNDTGVFEIQGKKLLIDDIRDTSIPMMHFEKFYGLCDNDINDRVQFHKPKQLPKGDDQYDVTYKLSQYKCNTMEMYIDTEALKDTQPEQFRPKVVIARGGKYARVIDGLVSGDLVYITDANDDILELQKMCDTFNTMEFRAFIGDVSGARVNDPVLMDRNRHNRGFFRLLAKDWYLRFS